MDGGTKISGARRPWDTAPSPDRSQKLVSRENEETAREREICLSCPLAACNPDWADCPLKACPREPKKNCHGNKPLPVPEEFFRLGPGPMTHRELAEVLGVSCGTVRRWRKKYGYLNNQNKEEIK